MRDERILFLRKWLESILEDFKLFEKIESGEISEDQSTEIVLNTFEEEFKEAIELIKLARVTNAK